jgi:hypothetical protein
MVAHYESDQPLCSVTKVFGTVLLYPYYNLVYKSKPEVQINNI